MKSSLTIIASALFLGIAASSASAATRFGNFESDYPMIQSVRGESPERAPALAPNDPNWPQLPAAHADKDASQKMESLRGRNFDGKDQQYIA